MDTGDVVLKNIPPVRVAHMSAVAASYDAPDITPVLTPLYDQLLPQVKTFGLTPTGAALAYYQPAPAEGPEAITVHAAVPVSGEPPADGPVEVIDLPGIEQAATLLHHGPMSNVDRTMQLLARWIDDNGYRVQGPGYAREVYLNCPPEQQEWITEMQLPVTRTDR